MTVYSVPIHQLSLRVVCAIRCHLHNIELNFCHRGSSYSVTVLSLAVCTWAKIDGLAKIYSKQKRCSYGKTNLYVI